MAGCECSACYFADVVTDDDEWDRYQDLWNDEHLTAELLDARRQLVERLARIEARLASVKSGR